MVENSSFNVILTAAFTKNEIERSESKVKHSFHCVPWCCENCIREKTSHYGANVILFLTPSKEIEVREFQLMGITKQSRLHRCSRTVPSTCSPVSPFYSVSLLDTRGPRGGHSPPKNGRCYSDNVRDNELCTVAGAWRPACSVARGKWPWSCAVAVQLPRSRCFTQLSAQGAIHWSLWYSYCQTTKVPLEFDG